MNFTSLESPPGCCAEMPGPLPPERRRLARSVVLLGTMALLLTVGAPRMRGDDASELLDRWLASQAEVQSWSADLIQTRSLRVMAQPLVSTGKVAMLAPDRFRWELGQPARTIAVRQPDALFIVYPLLKRAEKYPLSDEHEGPWKDTLALLEASFPRNRASLVSRFQILGVTQTNSLAEIRLSPISASARKMITELRVRLHTDPMILASTELRFQDGSSMRSDFSNVTVNPALDPELFEPTLGPDFTVTEPQP